MHVGGREDEDEDDAAAGSSGGAEPRARAELAAASDFIRDVAGRIALELATTAEGRAVGLSVDVWPAGTVALHARSGHELRLRVELRDDAAWVIWERLDPSPRGGRARASHGGLGKASALKDADVKAYLARWLARRVRG
jgi:hypothetical protein